LLDSGLKPDLDRFSPTVSDRDRCVICNAIDLRMKLSQDTARDGWETRTNVPCLSTTAPPPDSSVKQHGHHTEHGIRSPPEDENPPSYQADH